jgi:hypothetical protein
MSKLPGVTALRLSCREKQGDGSVVGPIMSVSDDRIEGFKGPHTVDLPCGKRVVGPFAGGSAFVVLLLGSARPHQPWPS